MKYDYLSAVELSDTGRQRRRNEDKTLILPEHGVFAVFDGMGGAHGGGEASATAAEAIRRKFAESAAQPSGLASLKGKVVMVRSALNEASREIRERAEAQGVVGAGTTAVVMIFDSAQPQRAIILHAGDSRAYRHRAGQLLLLTRDHSFAVAAGVASERSLPPMFRGVVTRAVGLEREVVLEETLVDVVTGDVFMICSDGVTKMLADGAISQIYQRIVPLSLPSLAATLIEEANIAGGHDNSSVVLVNVTGFVPVSATDGQTASLLPALTTKPVTEKIAQPVEKTAGRQSAALQNLVHNFGMLLVGIVATIAVVSGIYWLNLRKFDIAQPAATQTTPAPSAPEKSAPPPVQVAVATPPKTEPIVQPPVVAPPKTEAVVAKPPIVEIPKTQTPVAPPKTEPPVVAPPKTEVAATKPPVVEMPQLQPPVAPPKTEPPAVSPPPRKIEVVATQSPVVPPPPKVETPPVPPPATTHSPEAIAAAQEMMELLMTDMITALQEGHWSFVEETMADWSPTARNEAAAIIAWPVYRGWSAVWREASTGRQNFADLYEPHRAKISACLREMGSTATLPSPAWRNDPRRDADELCRLRYRAQGTLIEEMRRCGEDAARFASMLQKENFLFTAGRLRGRHANANLPALVGDFTARAGALVAGARTAAGTPAPMTAEDVATVFAGWTGLRLASEALIPELVVAIVTGDNLPSSGGTARQKELKELREKIDADRKKTADWSKWLAGEGPSDVIRYLMLAQSVMK